MTLQVSEAEFHELAARLERSAGSVSCSDLKPGPRVKARARVNERGTKSNLESRWMDYGGIVISSIVNLPVVKTIYEPFSLNIPGGGYTPDFLHILGDGSIMIVETKGNIRMKNARDSRTKFRAAAEVFAFFSFVWVEMIPDSNDVKIELYEPFETSKTIVYSLPGGYSPRRRRKSGRVK